MDREGAKEEIRSEWETILQSMTGAARKKAGGYQTYICPLCGNGSGGSGDGIAHIPQSKTKNKSNQYGLKCFVCGFSGDIIDLYQQKNGTDYFETLEILAKEIGVTIESPFDKAISSKKHHKTEQPDISTLEASQSLDTITGGNDTATDTESPTEGAEGSGADYTSYYRQCRERLTAPDCMNYLTKRGISAETAAAYWLGYDPAADPASAPGGIGEKKHPIPRLIIPTTKTHYVGRRIDQQSEYSKINVKDGKPGIFNLKAVYTPGVREVFITEGAIDALSVIEAGSPAIALNSTSNADALIERLSAKRPPASLGFIIALDNDKAGIKARDTIIEGLKRLNISYLVDNISGDHKDPNEALTADREGFIERVEDARRLYCKPYNTSIYLDTLFTTDIEKFKGEKPTGFSNLDARISGLYNGLYCLAAISSLGKTSFVLQIADQLAEQGNDVLFFSLEQSRFELVSKSIARRTAQNDINTAVNNLSIRKGYLPKQVQAAADEYKAKISDHMSIIEGNFDCDISFIGENVKEHIRRTGNRPVVIIDYLQIMNPPKDRGLTTKEIVDSNITDLKKLSRDLEMPIIAISSVNRTNYETPISFESLKESGSIEYSCDVVWGLQLQCLNDPLFEKATGAVEKRKKIEEAKNAEPRKIELRCLKNRFGRAHFSCFFEYYAGNDLFIPDYDYEDKDTSRRKGAARL